MVVRGEHSPYNEMMKKTKDIDIDFFENVFRGIYTLSEELNPQLKDKVTDVFEKMADSYYKDGDLGSRLLTLIQNEADNIKNKFGSDSVDLFLNNLADDLYSYVKYPDMEIGFPKYTNSDVEELYQDAKHITIIEFFSGGNGQDILAFYEALMDNTWWACRDVIANRTKEFIMGLAAKTREIGPIQ